MLSLEWRALRGDADVTKKEIVKTISEEIGLTQLKTKEIVQKTFDATASCTTTCERFRWTFGPSTQQRSWLVSTVQPAAFS